MPEGAPFLPRVRNVADQSTDGYAAYRDAKAPKAGSAPSPPPSMCANSRMSRSGDPKVTRARSYWLLSMLSWVNSGYVAGLASLRFDRKWLSVTGMLAPP